MIDFLRINDFGTGQRDSFEELVKVLARREQPEKANEYQPYDGRGGDGGVEAIWLLTDGSKVGYQSKFFSSLGASQWKQMDDSVSQALATHPQLIKYVFALPFDLTPDRGPKTRGKSQIQKWDEHVIRWKAVAKKQSTTLDFELWGATVLTDKLLEDGNGSLRAHWFDEEVLDSQWFQEKVSAAALKLDDRYNPDDHVKVSVESLFDAVVRGPKTRQQLSDSIDGLRRNRVPKIEFPKAELVPNKDALRAMQKNWKRLTSAQPKIEALPDTPWEWSILAINANQLYDETAKVLRPFFSIDKSTLSEAERWKTDVTIEDLRKLSSAASKTASEFESKDLRAETHQCALVVGEAGSGKSHVFGQIASQRISQSLPTVLILGQDMGEAPFWDQFASLLGIGGNSADDVLGTLNAVGERLRTRTLIMFDAINEGVGAKYWCHWFPEVIAEVQSYPFVAAVFSCRDVYVNYAVPSNLLNSLPKYRIEGFSTPEERERAAIQYLDKNGISRPNTLWLSPEFSNPLFLKSTSEALVANGKTEFPRGLHGTSQMLSLYLESFSTRMEAHSSRSTELSRPLMKLVRTISERMADEGQDFITVDIADEIIGNYFGNRLPPDGKTWLEVFIQTNLFRREPPPPTDCDNPLDPPAELIRFSFQRFQDFLMANALVDKIVDANSDSGTGQEFAQSGPLSFLFYGDELNQGIRYEFAGLVAALSTIFPERLEAEFAMSLRNWEQHWEEDHLLQPAFAESFKWRRLDAFNDDTLKLLNNLNSVWVETLGLLLEVSMTVDHPFNAYCLHEHLNRFSLAERDSYWTQWINYSSREELSQIDRIVSWALPPLDDKADKYHIELAAIALAWFLSSSHMSLRDRATKALTSLLLRHCTAFELVLDKMKDCNDPYIVERMYAAAFGACCIDPSPSRLRSYSQSVFNAVFAKGEPPIALLTRDYALGIIELAEHKGSTGPSVILARCYHPFSTDPPQFGLTEDEVKRIAQHSGSDRILNSAGFESGDYGKYSIPGRVRGFLATPLSKPAPKSKEELKQACYDEVVSGRQDRIDALEAYNQSTLFQSQILDQLVNQRVDADAARQAIDEAQRRSRDLRNDFENLLTDDERRRVSEEYFIDGMVQEDHEHVSIQQCRWWITKRAYELGWTKTLFPSDNYGGSYSGHKNDLERIGKKYQRIALDELEARLADNFWLLQGWGIGSTSYRYSHHDFRRNLEPTILPNNPCSAPDQLVKDAWIIEPKIELPDVPEEDLRDWTTQFDPGKTEADFIYRNSPDGRRWIVLYDHVQDRDYYVENGRSGHNIRMVEFRITNCILVPNGQAERLANSLRDQQDIDFFRFQPSEYMNGPFIGEAFWRNTWETTNSRGDNWTVHGESRVAIPVANYQWGINLDRTLPNGFFSYLPERWFAEELGLANHSEDFSGWFREAGEEVFKVFNESEGHQSGVVVEACTLYDYLGSQELEPVWVFIAQRSACPNGDNDRACWRRSEAVIWKSGTNWKSTKWFRDERNG